MTAAVPSLSTLTAPPGRTRWVVVGAVIVGFLLRVAWALWATRDPQGENDPTIYLGLAERLADGQGYVLDTGEPTAYFPPGFPAVLALVFRLASLVGLEGSRPEVAAGLNVVLGSAVVALMALVAIRVFGWRVAAVVAVLLACFPTLIGYSSLALSEPLFLFLVAASFTLALWEPFTVEHPNWVRLIASSALLGAALLVRPVGGLLVVALVVGLALASGRRLLTLARVGVVVGVVALVLVPWGVRNALVVDAGFTLSTNTGDNLCIGNNPTAGGTFQVAPYCFDDLPDQDAAGDVAEVARARTTQERALEWIRENPLEQPRLVLLRTAATFQNGHEFRWASESYGSDLWLDEPTIVLVDWVADLGWFGMIAFGLAGVVVLWDRRDPRRIVLLLAIGGLTVASWPFFGNPRFGVPAVTFMVFPAALVVAALPLVWARVRAGLDPGGAPVSASDPDAEAQRPLAASS